MMLGLFGIRPTPAVRALIGAVLLAIGLFGHAPFLAVAGGVLIVWAVVSGFSLLRSRGQRDRVGGGGLR